MYIPRLTMIIWDLAGEDKFEKIRSSYIKGASGYLLVIDGTRRSTFEQAIELH
ncbi:MAG: GTP-binding protein, partial [Bacteroidota bacterium]